MEIKSEVVKQFMSNLMKTLRMYELDLAAYQRLFSMMDVAYPEEKLNQKLQDTKNSPDIQHYLREKYDVPLEKFVQTVDQLGFAKAMATMFQDFQKRTSVN